MDFKKCCGITNKRLWSWCVMPKCPDRHGLHLTQTGLISKSSGFNYTKAPQLIIVEIAVCFLFGAVNPEVDECTCAQSLCWDPDESHGREGHPCPYLQGAQCPGGELPHPPCWLLPSASVCPKLRWGRAVAFLQPEALWEKRGEIRSKCTLGKEEQGLSCLPFPTPTAASITAKVL